MTVVSDGLYLVSESTKLLGFLSWALFRDSRPAVQCHISAAAYDTPLKNVILTVNQSEEQKKTYSTFYMGNSLKIYNFANSVPFRWSLQILSGPIDICPSKYHHLGQRDLWTRPMLNLLTPPQIKQLCSNVTIYFQSAGWAAHFMYVSQSNQEEAGNHCLPSSLGIC